MTPEFWAIIAVGVALATLILTSQRSLRSEVAAVRADVGQLRERMAHLEGLLEGLRDAVGRNRVA